MQWRRCKVITRDFLMNADCKTAFGAIEESLLWSAEQRAASLAATLACRPDEGPVWIFGYGSLMWNPALEFTESCTGTLVGWHRAFCLRLTAGRGTAHQPGRMLALKRGRTHHRRRLSTARRDAGAGTNPVVEARDDYRLLSANLVSA